MSVQPGEHSISIPFDGQARSYIMFLPQAVQQARQLPVVLNFHGGGGNARGYMQYTCMNEVAEKYGFVVVYPNGSGERKDKFLSWNAGSCCGYACAKQVDDVGFVSALLEDVTRRIPCDASRVYATGISNGAMMAYRLGSELSGSVAAIAAVAGGAVIDTIQADRAVPLMHIHSVDDPRALFAGGLGPNFPMTKTRVNHPNIENVLRLWVAHNNCSPTPVVEPAIIKQMPGSRHAEHTAQKHVYPALYQSGQGKEAEVVFWKLSGAGHVWPGGLQAYMEALLGDSTDVIDANEEIWQFFANYSL